jgi:uncharacterized membrane protein
MSIIDILLKAGVAAAELVKLLIRAKEIAPDLAAEVDKILAELAAAVEPTHLIALAEALPRELANISQGQIDPRRHPSDVA